MIDNLRELSYKVKNESLEVTELQEEIEGYKMLVQEQLMKRNLAIKTNASEN